MEYDELIQRVQEAQSRLAKMVHPARGSAEQDSARPDLQQELSSALEELHVASEGLHQQNAELLATRQAVEEERRRYQDLFEFAPDGYLVTDTNGVIQEANGAAATMLGVEAQFLAGKPILVFVAVEDRETFHTRLARALVDARTGEDWEIGLSPRSGAAFSAAITVCRVQASDGHVVGIRWMLRNISERARAAEALRQANEGLERRVQDRTVDQAQANEALRIEIAEHERMAKALRESEERLRMALQAAGAGSWEWNLRIGEITWSDEHHALFGAAAGAFEPTYEAWLEAIHPDDRNITEGLVRRAMSLKQNLDIEYRIIRPDGDVRWLNTRGHSFSDEAGLPVRMLGITVDVTQRKQAEETLLRAGDTLEYQLTDRTEELMGASRRLQVELTRHERTEEEIRKLGQTLEQRASELVALDRIGRALTRSLDPEAVLWLLVAEVRSLLGTEGAGVLQHDPRSGELVFVAAEGAGLGKLMGQRVPTTGSIVGWVFQERQALLVDDVRNDPRFYGGLLGLTEIPLRSMAAVPLISRGAVIGILGTINKLAGVFSEHDLQLLAAVANPAAVAIENARLFAAEQGRGQRLEAVRAFTAEITRELELAKVLKIIVHRATELVGVGTGTVWLWDEGEQALVACARQHLGPGEDRLAGRKLRLGEGVAGVVAEERRGVVVNEYQAWPHALPSLLEGSTVTAAMGEPLMFGDRFLGALVVNNEGSGRMFNEDDEQLLALLASHAAIAIENARLFEEVQAARQRVENLSRKLVEIQETERRHIARELHDEIGQSLTGLKLLLDMSARSSPDQARENQADVQVLVNDLLSQVRNLSLELRPAMLDDLGLLPALVWYFERYRSRTSVQVVFKHVGVDGRRFPNDVETAAYRIVQEALTNVARYAGVDEVAVRLWADDETLGVQVEDRGAGFDPEVALASHISSGLAGMRERSGLLGGWLGIESAPGAGTCVAAEFPIGSMKRET